VERTPDDFADGVLQWITARRTAEQNRESGARIYSESVESTPIGSTRSPRDELERLYRRSMMEVLKSVVDFVPVLRVGSASSALAGFVLWAERIVRCLVRRAPYHSICCVVSVLVDVSTHARLRVLRDPL
jgi:hypothetical protein